MLIERPIILRAEVIRAILEGTKTQTRRPIKPQPYFNEEDGSFAGFYQYAFKGITSDASNVSTEALCQISKTCRFGKKGEHLWVREQFCIVGHNYTRSDVIYRTEVADSAAKMFHWKCGMAMPRWACRIILEITQVHVERLRQISKEDVIAEGILPRELTKAASRDYLISST